jgi:hypothetical protein
MITENFKRRPIRSDLVHSELSGDIETAAKHGKGETPQRMNEPGWTETACIDHDRRRTLCTRHLERMFQAENRVSLLNGEGHWCIGEPGLSRYPSAQSRWGCLLMAVTGFCRPSGRHTRFVISPTWSGIQRVAFSERTPYACDWHCQYYRILQATRLRSQCKGMPYYAILHTLRLSSTSVRSLFHTLLRHPLLDFLWNPSPQLDGERAGGGSGQERDHRAVSKRVESRKGAATVHPRDWTAERPIQTNDYSRRIRLRAMAFPRQAHAPPKFDLVDPTD